MRSQRRERGLDIAEVSRVLVRQLGRAHADEVNIRTLGDLGVVRGEPQPAAIVLFQQVRQIRFVERHHALAEKRDLVGIDIEPDDLVAELGHAYGMRDAQISGADDREPRPFRRHSHSALSSDEPFNAEPTVKGSPREGGSAESARFRRVGSAADMGVL